MSDELVKLLRKGDPFGGVMQRAADRIAALEAALAKADELAEALCAEGKTAGQDVWAMLDACEVTDNALTAYRQARDATT